MMILMRTLYRSRGLISSCQALLSEGVVCNLGALNTSRGKSDRPYPSDPLHISRHISTAANGTAKQDSHRSTTAETSTAPRYLLDLPSTALTKEHFGCYYPLNTSLVPEALPALHQAFYAPSSQGTKLRTSGCTGLQAEESAVSNGGRFTSGPLVMYRRSLHLLMAHVLGKLLPPNPHLAPASAPAGVVDVGAGLGPDDQLQDMTETQQSGSAEGTGQAARLLLRGPTGSGKSVALAALVERARAAGWIVLYIPSARALVAGGYFTPRITSTGVSFDTQISAQHILLAMRTVHETQLSKLPVSTDTGRQLLRRVGSTNSSATVLDVVQAGLATDTDGALAVDAALALVTELAAVPRSVSNVLLAVDDYNVLYGKTDYGWPRSMTDASSSAVGADGQYRRQLLHVEDLTLARGLRLLAAELVLLGNANVAVATTAHETTFSRTPCALPATAGVAALTMPRLSGSEMATMLYHYFAAGVCAQPPTWGQVQQLEVLTNGNAEELRRVLVQAPLLNARNRRAVLSAV